VFIGSKPSDKSDRHETTTQRSSPVYAVDDELDKRSSPVYAVDDESDKRSSAIRADGESDRHATIIVRTAAARRFFVAHIGNRYTNALLPQRSIQSTNFFL